MSRAGSIALIATLRIVQSAMDLDPDIRLPRSAPRATQREARALNVLLVEEGAPCKHGDDSSAENGLVWPFRGMKTKFSAGKMSRCDPGLQSLLVGDYFCGLEADAKRRGGSNGCA